MGDESDDPLAPKPEERPRSLRDMSPRIGIGCYALMVVILAALVFIAIVFREHLWG